MRPHAVTNQIAQYCAAVAAQRTSVVTHAFVVMSNHHHLVISDPDGVLPEFLRELHRLTAKALNASQGQWENLWFAEKASAVRLPTLRDVVDKIAYCAANPVAAALVDAPRQMAGRQPVASGFESQDRSLGRVLRSGREYARLGRATMRAADCE